MIRHGDKVGTADVQVIGQFDGVDPLRKFVDSSGFNTEWEWARMITQTSPYGKLCYYIYHVSNFKTNMEVGGIH